MLRSVFELVPFQFWCDEVLVDKAEVPRPLVEKLLSQVQQRVMERGFHPYL